MRMWGISPKFLCRAHLLGEHREMHCAYASVNSVFLIKGYCNGLVDFNKLKDRHDELVAEMKKRGYKHNDSDVINNEGILCDEVDVEHNMKELKIRCSKCRELMKE